MLKDSPSARKGLMTNWPNSMSFAHMKHICVNDLTIAKARGHGQGLFPHEDHRAQAAD